MLHDLITNPLLYTPCVAWAVSQLIKMILLLCVEHKGLQALATGGGMPSSHTATVIGFLCATVLHYGTGGFEFPMALFFSIIVIFDALHVRYESGEQSKVLNHMIEDSEDAFYRGRRPFRENLGHTPAEIFVGAVIGLITALLLYMALH